MLWAITFMVGVWTALETVDAYQQYQSEKSKEGVTAETLAVLRWWYRVITLARAIPLLLALRFELLGLNDGALEQIIYSVALAGGPRLVYYELIFFGAWGWHFYNAAQQARLKRAHLQSIRNIEREEESPSPATANLAV
jgi:hypothetical protein